MGVKVNLIGNASNVDTGTGFTSHNEEPVTFSDAGVGEEPTGFARQQDAEVTYEDRAFEGKPTGFVEPQIEVTVEDAATVARREAAEAEQKRRKNATTKKSTAKNKARSTK